jgi:acetyl-CoA acetyltransferase
VNTGITDRSAIVGIGETEYSSRSGRSELRLALEAAQAALDDAGLPRSEIDGLVRFGVGQAGISEAWLAHNLGLPNVRFWSGIDFGGSAACALVGHAAMAVATGAANYVLAFRALNGRSERRPGTDETYRLYRGADPSYDNFLVPYGLTAPTQVTALIARRQMHEYGYTTEHYAAIATTARDYANRNPRAQMHGRPMSIDDYLTSPVISTPLRKFDICLQSDGAAALIVTTAERARDLRRPPIYVKAATQAMMPGVQGPLHGLVGRQDLLDTPGRQAAKEIYRQSGLRPSDVDVAQLYDCYTPTVLMQLDAYGFCDKGEAGPFVASGALALDGALPTNTSGGHLSEGYMHGVNHILEGVRQLRGTSTAQVSNAEICLVAAVLPNPTSALMLGRSAG